jgi:hypothetical protein
MRIAGPETCKSGTCAIHNWTLCHSLGAVDRPSHNGGKNPDPVASRWEMTPWLVE